MTETTEPDGRDRVLADIRAAAAWIASHGPPPPHILFVTPEQVTALDARFGADGEDQDGPAFGCMRAVAWTVVTELPDGMTANDPRILDVRRMPADRLCDSLENIAARMEPETTHG